MAHEVRRTALARAPQGASLTTRTLAYHDVVQPDGAASGFEGAGAERYKLTAGAFDAHLSAIEQAVSGPPALCSADPFPSSSWLLTFDDGGASARAIGERLAERSWLGHFFVTSGRIGQRGFLTGGDVVALSALGHVIGSHSLSHPARMSRCTPAQLLDEWRRSCDTLGGLLGRPIHCASVPGGYYSRRVAQAASASGLGALFTSEPRGDVREVDGCAVLGRYSIVRTTPPAVAAALASGRLLPRARQLAAWNTRKAAKLIAGSAYIRLREQMLAGRERR